MLQFINLTQNILYLTLKNEFFEANDIGLNF